MIGSLTGTVSGQRNGRIVLKVGDVGYLVSVRSPFDFKEMDKVTLHTYLAVRENALDLYGFLTCDELTLFEELITLPKIGPKTALQILIQADPKTILHAVTTQDPVYLTKMSGIGKKTAEKLVLELKDRFDTPLHTHDTSQEDTDVIDALLALGYAHKDVRDALTKLSPEIVDTKKRITEALRLLTR